MKKFLLLVCWALLLSQSSMFAQVKAKDVKTDLTKLLGSTNAGTEFYVSFPPCYEEESQGAANATVLFVASAIKQPITVEIPGTGYSQTQMAKANDVIEFRFTPAQGQPYTKRGGQKAPPERIYGKCGIHLTSLAPVVVYGVSRFFYTSDGFLAIPVSGLGTKYVVESYPQYTATGSTYKLPSMTNIVAAYDNTVVTFIMGGNKASITTGGQKPNQSRQWTLMEGDVLCYANDDDGQDLSGSLITSDKPVAVTSGNQCANIPAGVYACDYTVDMDIPCETWGKEYHVTPVKNRLYNPVVRVYAHPDYKNIQIYRDGQPWKVLSNNNRTENSAFFEARSSDGSPRPVVISGDKPIHVSLYNPGQTDDDVSSDPFQYVLTPIEQYQTEIVFATPAAKGGMAPFDRNFVNIVYAVGEGDVIPQDLEFASVNNGAFEWRTVASRFGSSPGKLFTSISSNGERYAIKQIDLPTVGVYRIRAKKPFAAYAYGFSNYDSYGFPTSVALGNLSKKDTVNPNPEYKVLCDGSVVGADGKSPIVTDLPNDANVRSNLAIIYMDQDPDSSYNYDFKFDKIIAGQSIRTNWTLKVIDPAKDARAKLYFIDKAGNDTSITIQYNAFKVILETNPTDFGAVKVGQLVTKTFKAINNSDFPATVKRLELKDSKVGFTITETNGTAISLPFTMSPKEEKTFNVSFISDKSGDFRDHIGIGDDCVFGYPVEVLAKPGEPIILVESDAIFGQMTVNDNAERDFTVRNIGTAPLVVEGYTLPVNPEFTIYYNGTKLDGTNGITKTNPLILQPNGPPRAFKVRFIPTAEKKYDDKMEFISDAGTNIDNVELMSGEGIKPGLLATGFDWKRRRIKKDYNEVAAITLRNTGTQAITITDASNPTAEFKYNKVDLTITLQPNESKTIPVTFNPPMRGDMNYTVKFTTNDPTINPEAILLGAGILGKIKTSDVDFGQTALDNGVAVATQAVVKKVRFEYEDDLFGDSVTVQLPFTVNLGEMPIGATNSNVYGSQGFAHDPTTTVTNGTATAQTVTLYKVGDYVEFDAVFNGQSEGSFQTQVISRSDAEADQTSTLRGTTINIPSGTGILQTVHVDPPVLCVGDPNPAATVITVSNTGDADLTVSSITYNPDPMTTQNWSVVQDYSPTYFVVTEKGTADEKRDITYQFNTPTTAGTYSVDVTVVSSVGNRTETLTGRTVAYSGGLDINKVSGDIQYGQNATYKVTLSAASEPVEAKVKDLTLTITYPSEMFIYQGGVSVNNPNWTLAGAPVDNNGSLVIKLTSSVASPIPGNNAMIDLVNVSFFTLLPSSNSFAKGTVTAGAEANLCFPISGDGIEVVPPATCYNQARRISMSGQSNGISSITPNPTTSAGGEVNFSIGLKTTTTITIIDGIGKEVLTLPLGILEPGEYSVNVPTDNLSSGTYTVKLVSGPYSHVSSMAVTK